MQIPLFAPTTKGQWGLRFDTFLAQALELGPLRKEEPALSSELVERLHSLIPKIVPLEMVTMLVAYYFANKPEDTDWVVLPVANFDAYFGTTSFGRKYLKQNPGNHPGAIRSRFWTVPVSGGRGIDLLYAMNRSGRTADALSGRSIRYDRSFI